MRPSRYRQCGELSNGGGMLAVRVTVCEERGKNFLTVFLFTYYYYGFMLRIMSHSFVFKFHISSVVYPNNTLKFGLLLP